MASKKKAITEEQKAIADQQITDIQRKIEYDLRDFTIDYIVQKFREDHFYIPDYQRDFIWRDHHKNRFIESLILGLPIPFMFAAEMEDGRLEVVDGAQRIQTLESFLNNDFPLKNLDKLPTLNDFRYKDLPGSQQRKLGNRALRMIILEGKTTSDITHEIFSRINTSGERARPSEIRKGTYTGPFMTFISDCASDPLFLATCPISKSVSKRGEGEELVLRFFAYSDRYLTFQHDVDRFLGKYVVDNMGDFNAEMMKIEFLRMLEFVKKFFPYGFAKSSNSKSTPRVRFEAISIGVNLALRKKPDLIAGSMAWLDSDEFKEHTTTHASNSGPRLKGRVEFVRDALLRGAE